MKIVHLVGEHAGKIEEKSTEVARRLLVVGSARVPTHSELRTLETVAEKPVAEKPKAAKRAKSKK